MKRILAFAALVGIGTALAARPTDPFVRRAVMREKARMVLIALHPELSLAYDGQGAYLYNAWKGGMQNGNSTYAHNDNTRGGNRGATYYPTTNYLYVNSPGSGAVSATPINAGNDGRPISFSPKNEALVEVWGATRSGTGVPVAADFRGYTIDNAAEKVTLRYGLTIAGTVVLVDEVPEHATVAGGVGLQRDFTFKGIPAGTSVALQLSGRGVSGVTEDWTAAGDGKVEKRGDKNYLIVDKDGTVRVTGSWKG